MSHLSREELGRWYERGEQADRDRVVSHLAVCDDCVRLYSEVLDERRFDAPLATGPGTDQHLREAGYGVYPDRAARRSWVNRRWLAAAAAAVVIIAAGVGLWPRQPAVSDTSSTGIRGSEIQPLAPVGDVDGMLAFRWASPVTAAVYRLDIADESGSVVHSEHVPAETWTASRELISRLTPAVRYTWTVTALDRDRQPILTSRPQPFSVR